MGASRKVRRRLFRLTIIAPLFVALLLTHAHCPQNQEDALMLHLYHTLHQEILQATSGTAITPAYMAALISLESSPPGNRQSERFEESVYRRLIDLKKNGSSFGAIRRSQVANLSDEKLRLLSTSYGLTQILGYHCLWMGCSLDDLRGQDHMLWAVSWMLENYRDHMSRGDWANCFRIHNTGRPDGTTHRADYVEIGLRRMAYYAEWERLNGNPFSRSAAR